MAKPKYKLSQRPVFALKSHSWTTQDVIWNIEIWKIWSM